MADVKSIKPNPNQPRKAFDDDALAELAESIKNDGLLQPIVVTGTAEGYTIVAGERRWRASMLAGLTHVPVILRNTSADKEFLGLALIENLLREDLNPVEEAEAYKRLSDDFKMSHDEIAKTIGKSRSAISNSIRVLSLHPTILTALRERKVTVGQVRPLLGLSEKAALDLFERIVTLGISARGAEKELKKKRDKKKGGSEFDENVHVKDALDRLMQKFGRGVKVQGTSKKGQVSFDYYSKEDLIDLFEVLLQN